LETTRRIALGQMFHVKHAIPRKVRAHAPNRPGLVIARRVPWLPVVVILSSSLRIDSAFKEGVRAFRPARMQTTWRS